VEISAARPPRLMFVVERLPDAFHRKIKQLGFSEADCVEFRHLDVSGTPAAYFDTIARLRRGGSLAAERAAEPIVRRAPGPIARHAAEPQMAERPADRMADKVVLLAAPSAARATSVRLQKLMNNGAATEPAADARPARATERAAAPVIEIATRSAAAPALRVEGAAPRIEPVRVEAPRPAPKPVGAATAVIEPIARVSLRAAVAAPALVAVAEVATEAPARAARTQAPEPRVSFAEIAQELLGTSAPRPRLQAPAVIPRPPVEEITRAALEEMVAAAADAISEPQSAVVLEDAPVTLELEDEPLAAEEVAAIVEPEPVAAAAPVVVEAPAAPAPAPVVAPAPVAWTTSEPQPAAAAPAPSPPLEFEGMKFPNDGVLTRQWMEFLNQMAATK
jgi:hypothetical protein